MWSKLEVIERKKDGKAIKVTHLRRSGMVPSTSSTCGMQSCRSYVVPSQLVLSVESVTLALSIYIQYHIHTHLYANLCIDIPHQDMSPQTYPKHAAHRVMIFLSLRLPPGVVGRPKVFLEKSFETVQVPRGVTYSHWKSIRCESI